MSRLYMLKMGPEPAALVELQLPTRQQHVHQRQAFAQRELLQGSTVVQPGLGLWNGVGYGGRYVEATNQGGDDGGWWW